MKIKILIDNFIKTNIENNKIKMKLIQTGQKYDTINGYTDFRIKINKKPVLDLPANWKIKDEILIGKSNGTYRANGETLPHGDYQIAVYLFEHIIWYGYITIEEDLNE